MPRKKQPRDPNKKPVSRPDHKIPAFKKVMIQVLHDQGMSCRAVAKKLGLSHTGVGNVLREGLDEMEEASVSAIKKRTSGELALLNGSILSALREPGVIDSANFRDLMIGLGIGIEKQRLVDGESTSNVFSLIQLQAQVETKATKTLPGTAVAPAIEAPTEQPALPSPSSDLVIVIPNNDGATVPRKAREK